MVRETGYRSQAETEDECKKKKKTYYQHCRLHEGSCEGRSH